MIITATHFVFIINAYTIRNKNATNKFHECNIIVSLTKTEYAEYKISKNIKDRGKEKWRKTIALGTNACAIVDMLMLQAFSFRRQTISLGIFIYNMRMDVDRI